MFVEKSCGAVVFTRLNGTIKYLLIRSRTGDYGFPKGHMEPGETEVQTALREVREEVGLEVTLLPNFRRELEYPLPQKENTIKQVVYFLGGYDGQPVTCQDEEVSEALLLDYEAAMELLRFENSKSLLAEANYFLSRVSGHVC